MLFHRRGKPIGAIVVAGTPPNRHSASASLHSSFQNIRVAQRHIFPSSSTSRRSGKPCRKACPAMVTPTSFMCVKSDWHNRPGRCLLYKEDLSAWTFCCAPLLNAALQRPQLARLQTFPAAHAAAFEDRLGFESGVDFNPFPDLSHSPRKHPSESAMYAPLSFRLATVHNPAAR